MAASLSFFISSQSVARRQGRIERWEEVSVEFSSGAVGLAMSYLVVSGICV